MKIFVRAKPNSGRQEVEKITEEEYKVFLKKSAQDGKANEELLKVLKKYFGRGVRIVSGKTSRKKIVELS